MDSLFSGLDAFGMEEIDTKDLFADTMGEPIEGMSQIEEIDIAELLYDRPVRCPVCNTVFNARTVKQGVTKMEGTQVNLRPIYKTVDLICYDVVHCEVCGYTALNRNFKKLSDRQVKQVKEKISMKFIGKKYPEVYSYDIALERYKMALYTDMVIARKEVDKAYLCLKITWLLESLIYQTKSEEEKEGLRQAYQIYVDNAYKGFSKNYSHVTFPIFGMNQSTYQYLLGSLAYAAKDLKNTSYWLGKIMLSPISSARIKDKARDLKAKIDEDKEEM